MAALAQYEVAMSSLSDAIDRSWVNFPCPKCGLENECRVQQAALQGRVHCRGCHETIQLVDKDASTVTAKRKIDSAFTTLKRAMKRIG